MTKEEDTSILYGVLTLKHSIKARDVEIELPEGQYYLPVFADYEKAKEYSNEKYPIVKLKIEDNGEY